jgi:uncharacterized protein YbaP (TraB family)
MWKTGLLALAGLFVASCAQAEPPVWIVRDNDSEMVLFGSVHVLPPGLDWRSAALDRALARADDLWFELPVDTATELEAAQVAAARGLLPADQTLSGLLPPADAARLAAAAQRYGLALPLLDRFEPWLAEVALAGGVYRAAGADTGSGVEKAISLAAPAKAARRAFETPAEQIAIFDDTPLADQIASLSQSLREIEEDPRAFEDLIHAWTTADVKGLERDALEPLRKTAPRLYRRVVTDRNARWTQALDARLKGRGRTVVVVGVAHLVGGDGLPARLRALGYAVEGP